MNKKKLSILLAVSAMGTVALMACSQGEDLSMAPEFKKVVLSDLKAGKPAGWAISDGWTNGTPFGVDWAATQAKFDDKGMTLSISKDEEGKYYGGEMKTTGEDGVFKHGYFGVRMKPSNAVGTVSSFFTYTGPSENDNPHDEIDIEFLGKDTTMVQFNYYAESEKSHEFKYNLGFDASKEFHDYGFYWDETQIIWYVDSKPVHRVNENIPVLGQRIMTNYWKGDDSKNITNWMGAYDDKNLTITQSEYEAIYYADLEGNGRIFETGPSSSESAPIELTFNDAEEYHVTNAEDNHSADVTYEGVTQSYHNINSALPADAASKNLFSTKIKNLGTEMAIVRININGQEQHGANDIYALNTKASIEGRGEVTTDLEWGGSYFNVDPGEELIANVEYAGKATNVELMIDSTRSDGPHSGHILFSEYKLGGSQEVDPNEPSDPVDDPVDPSEDENFDPTIVDGALAMPFAASSGFTVTNIKDNKAAEISYTDLAANYQTVYADLPADANTKNTFTAKVKNLRATTVSVRVNILEDKTHGANNIKVINTRGYYTGATTDVNTDLSWGGSFFEVGPNAEIEVNVVYEGDAKKVEFMVDSSKSTGTYSGHVGISNYRLSGEQIIDTPSDDNGEGGETSGEVVKTALTTKFVGNDVFTVADVEGGQSVSWDGVVGDSYSNIANAVVAEELAGAKTIEIAVTNTGEEDLTGRVDIMNWNPQTNLEKSNTVTGDMVSAGTDLEWGGSKYTLAAGKSGVITVTFEGEAQSILMFFNSSIYNDHETHTGSALISSVKAVF